jgi:pimeloyl-ACP methyl ester carboxylesterase
LVDITSVRLPFQGRTVAIEYAWLNPESRGSPLLVFLHSGLGSLAMWKDFPRLLCDAGGFRGLVFSRYGYGQSTPRPADEKWPVGFMHDQARDFLPAFLKKVVDPLDSPPWLFGHSDGGSIALIYAASFPDALSGVIAEAPHIYVEEVNLESIARAADRYRSADFRRILARYHADPDSAFWGWHDAWLNPAFRQWNIEGLLPSIKCPVLAVQGENDEYGTMSQIDGIRRLVARSELLKLDSCGHSPHVDRTEALIQAAVSFIRRRSTP